MSQGHATPAVVGAGILAATLGATLLGYRQVADPRPLGTLAAVALIVVVFFLACLGAGSWVPLLLSARRERSAELVLLSVAGGAATLAALAFALAAAGWLAPWVLLVALALAALAGVATLRRTPLPLMPRGLPAVFLAVAAAITLLPLPVPSGFYDQLNYHLAFPYHWLRQGRMVLFPGHDFSYLPATMGLLYTYALAGAGSWAAQAVHWGMGVLATAAAAALAARLAGPRGGAWAAAVLATTPTVLLTATWASADLGATALAACAWLAALRGLADPQQTRGPVVLAGLLAGAAAGAKALVFGTALLPLAAALVLVPAAGERWGALLPRLRRVAIFLAAAALAGAPWLVRNGMAVGDPFFPLVGRSPVAGATLEAGLRLPEAGLAGARQWLVERTPALLLGTFRPRGLAGNIGPVYLGLLPLALFWFARHRRRDAATLGLGLLLGVAAWSVVPQFGRYLLAPLVLAATLAGAALADLEAAVGGLVRRAVQGLVATAMLWALVGGVSPMAVNRAAAALGLLSEEEIVAREIDYWPAARFVNEHLPAQARLLLVAEARTLYLDRDLIVQDPFQVPLLTALADSLGSAAAVARELHRRGVTHLLFNASEARRMAAMNRRESYFAPATPAGRHALDEFFRDWTEPLFEARGVRVLRLKHLPRRDQ